MQSFSTLPIKFAAAALCLGAVACTAADEPANGGDDNLKQPGKYVLSATVQDSKGSSYVLLTANSLDSGRVSAVGNGLVNDGASQWVFHGSDYLYGLTYNQGNAAVTRSYVLGANGAVQPRDMEYKVSRYSSYGVVGDEILTMSTGDGPTAMADANGYLPKTLLTTRLNVKDETARQNDTSTGTYLMENYLGNGEFVTLAGVESVGNRIFTGVYPMGLSQYGAAVEGGKWVRPGYEHLVKTADGGSNSSAYKKGELQWTQYPDECWVAIYDDASMTRHTLLRTDRISQPAGRFKSQYYQMVWADADGDVYVFSPSYAKTMTDPLQQTKLPAGVVRIPAGKSQFDDYYVNLEAAAGGRSFMRVWPAGGSYFLMQMYDRPLTETGFVATDLAIFDAKTRQLTYVRNLPAEIESIGSNVYTENGKTYVILNVKDQFPAVYSINPSTATATKGLTIEANAVTGFGYLTAR